MKFGIASKFAALLLASSLATVGGTAHAKDYRIGYSIFWGTNPFLLAMVNGARAAAKEREAAGDKIDILLTNGGDSDKSKQVSDLEDLFAQKVDGLLVFPGDSVLVGEPITNLYNKNKIPVVITDIGVRKGDISTLVITDNHAGGIQAGDYMASLLPKGAKVITLDYAPTNDNGQLRRKSFEARAAELGLNVLPEVAMPPELSLENGRRSTEDLLVAEPNIAGIFSFNQLVLQGAYAALESAGMAGKVKLVGFDLDPVSYKMVQDGKIDALVVQDPYRIGHDGLINLMKKLDGEAFEANILLPTKLMTKANTADFASDPQVTGK